METSLLILAILGGLDLSFRALTFLANFFPRLLTAQRKVVLFLGDLIAVPHLRRKVVSTRVEEVLNQSAFGLAKYLPPDWIRRARVQWVRKSTFKQLAKGHLVLRIRPDRDLDVNLMRSLWYYFYSSIFPNSRDLISDQLANGASLAIARASIEESHPHLLGSLSDPQE